MLKVDTYMLVSSILDDSAYLVACILGTVCVQSERLVQQLRLTPTQNSLSIESSLLPVYYPNTLQSLSFHCI